MTSAHLNCSSFVYCHRIRWQMVNPDTHSHLEEWITWFICIININYRCLLSWLLRFELHIHWFIIRGHISYFCCHWLFLDSQKWIFYNFVEITVKRIMIDLSLRLWIITFDIILCIRHIVIFIFFGVFNFLRSWSVCLFWWCGSWSWSWIDLNIIVS